MDVLPLIGGAIQSVDAALRAGKLIAGAEHALDQAQLKLQLADVIGALADAKVQLAELRTAANEDAEWTKRRDGYSLVKTPAGGLVQESKADPKHYACPACFESDREIHALQPVGHFEYSGSMSCPSCETQYPVAIPRDPPELERDYDPFSR